MIGIVLIADISKQPTKCRKIMRTTDNTGSATVDSILQRVCLRHNPGQHLEWNLDVMARPDETWMHDGYYVPFYRENLDIAWLTMIDMLKNAEANGEFDYPRSETDGGRR